MALSKSSNAYNRQNWEDAVRMLTSRVDVRGARIWNRGWAGVKCEVRGGKMRGTGARRSV